MCFVVYLNGVLQLKWTRYPTAMATMHLRSWQLLL